MFSPSGDNAGPPVSVATFGGPEPSAPFARQAPGADAVSNLDTRRPCGYVKGDRNLSHDDGRTCSSLFRRCSRKANAGDSSLNPHALQEDRLGEKGAVSRGRGNSSSMCTKECQHEHLRTKLIKKKQIKNNPYDISYTLYRLSLFVKPHIIVSACLQPGSAAT